MSVICEICTYEDEADEKEQGHVLTNKCSTAVVRPDLGQCHLRQGILACFDTLGQTFCFGAVGRQPCLASRGRSERHSSVGVQVNLERVDDERYDGVAVAACRQRASVQWRAS